jgi:primosomal protein N'
MANEGCLFEVVILTKWCSAQERLQLYKKKVQKVESQKWLSEHRRSLAVDVSAANRFISHAIPELNPQQHQALREVMHQEVALIFGLSPHSDTGSRFTFAFVLLAAT